VISLVLPAYNPGPRIIPTWHAVRDFVRQRPDAWEVLFVLDGCTDDTAERLNILSQVAPHPHLRVLQYPINRGKGFAVRHGLTSAVGRYRLFTDVDLAYTFEDVLRLVEVLQKGADVVVASRTHPKSEILLPTNLLGYAYRRRLQSRVFAWVTRQLLPITLTDTQAGLKGMTAAVAERVVPELTCDGFGFDCEFLTACHSGGVSVVELPVRVRYEDAASTANAAGFHMLRELWAIRRHWRQRVPLGVPGVQQKAA
jgi:dolichyl-phosphate beta-glucosyltransferase